MGKKRAVGKQEAGSPLADPASCIEAAQEALGFFPPDELGALKILEKAVESFPNSVQCLSALAELLCTAGHPSVRNDCKAVELLKNSLQLDPSGFPERYFYLGQLLAGDAETAKDAERSYRSGIEVLETELVCRDCLF